MTENGNMLQQITLSPNMSFPDYKTHFSPPCIMLPNILQSYGLKAY